MQRFARFAAALALATLGVGALPAAVGASPDQEACMMAEINTARATAGVPALIVNADLTGIAQTHSQDMAAAGALSHNQELPQLVPPTWQVLGENIGDGSSCDQVATALMNEPLHLRNILDPTFTTVGVGVADDAAGMLWVTEDFMGTGAPASPPAPAQPAVAAVSPVAPQAQVMSHPVAPVMMSHPVAPGLARPSPSPVPAPSPAAAAMPLTDAGAIPAPILGDALPAGLSSLSSVAPPTEPSLGPIATRRVHGKSLLQRAWGAVLAFISRLV